jgi:two-component system sensor histidine kinase KdpD
MTQLQQRDTPAAPSAVGRVVVAVAGAPGSEHLIREAARLARRDHLPLVGLHVRPPHQPATGMDEPRRLLGELGGTYREVESDQVADTIRAFASAPSTRLVLGATRDPVWRRAAGLSVLDQVSRYPGIEVHLVPRADRGAATARRYLPTPLSPMRRTAGWAIVVLGVPALTAALAPFRHQDVLPSALLLFVLLIVTAAATGGTAPALLGALLAFLAVNWFLTPPFHTLDIATAANLTALVAFLVVAGVVGFLVGLVSRRSAEAVRARAEAHSLASAAASVAEATEPLAGLLQRLVAVLDLDGASLLEEKDGRWITRATSGAGAPLHPGDATSTQSVRPGTLLAWSGPEVDEATRPVLAGFAAQLATALEQHSLRLEAGRAGALAETDRLRTALLRAVSHDLRTPLASIKASVSSLNQDDIEWSPAEVAEFLSTIEEETDRLDHVVGNLLDMGRLQAGAVHVSRRPVALEEVVPAALTSLSCDTGVVDLDLDERSPRVEADPALLERALANIVSNAVAWTAPGTRVRIDGATRDREVDLRVIDRGPGVPAPHRDKVFEPFQRLGDRSNEAGAGLGLAVAKGFVEAMEGRITLTDTPGGGLTVVVTLPEATP